MFFLDEGGSLGKKNSFDGGLLRNASPPKQLLQVQKK